MVLFNILVLRVANSCSASDGVEQAPIFNSKHATIAPALRYYFHLFIIKGRVVPVRPLPLLQWTTHTFLGW